MAIDRRGFLKTLTAAIASTGISTFLPADVLDDPDKLLWNPEAKKIFIPGVSAESKVVLTDDQPRIITQTLIESPSRFRVVHMDGVVEEFASLERGASPTRVYDKRTGKPVVGFDGGLMLHPMENWYLKRGMR